MLLVNYTGALAGRLLLRVIVCIVIAPPLTLWAAQGTSLTLTSKPSAPVFGQSVVLTANIAPVAQSGAPVFTGQVTFREGDTALGTGAVISGSATLTVSGLIAGTHTITAAYGGDSNWSSSQAAATMTVAPASTTTRISLTIDSSGSMRMLAVVAAAPPGAGTPTGTVQFLDTKPNGSVVGRATLAGGSGSAPWPYTSVSINGILPSPTAAVTAVYSGDVNFKTSTSAQLLRAISAAANLGISFAPDQAVSVFNVVGLSGDIAASLPLPVSLGGVTVKLKDSAGASRAAALYGVFASSGQINFVIPSDTAPGSAELTITLPDGGTLVTVITVTSTAPSIFTASRNGQGVFAGQVVHVHADGSQTIENSAALDAATNTYVPTGIEMGPPTDQVYLVLYGTGVRHACPDTVFAFVNKADVEVLFAPQGQFPGLDQINLRIPRSLGGSGTVNIAVEVAGPTGRLIPANTVTVLFR